MELVAGKRTRIVGSDRSDRAMAHGLRTLFNWNYQHLMEPDKILPHTTMPTFNFQPEEARDLTLLMLSWRREMFPPEYIPAPIEAVAVPAPSPSAAPSPAPTPKPTAVP